MKTVFIVQAGCYDDGNIVGVFTDRELADNAAAAHTDSAIYEMPVNGGNEERAQVRMGEAHEAYLRAVQNMKKKRAK